MNKTDTFQSINRESLLAGLKRGTRKKVEALLNEPDIHYLAQIQNDEGSRRLITVGPTLEFTTIEQVIASLDSEFYLDGYYDNRTPELRINEAEEALRVQKDQNLKLRALCDRLEQEVVRSEERREITIREYSALEQKMKDKEEEFIRARKLRMEAEQELKCIKAREADLLKMEEALVEKMNLHVIKETEMEQREEDLFRRAASVIG